MNKALLPTSLQPSNAGHCGALWGGEWWELLNMGRNSNINLLMPALRLQAGRYAQCDDNTAKFMNFSL